MSDNNKDNLEITPELPENEVGLNQVNELDSGSKPIPESAPQAVKTNIAKDSTTRLLNNGKMRFAIVAIIGGVAVVGVAGNYFASLASKPVVVETEASINLPKTSVQANAISTPEQAEFIKSQQQLAGEEAEKKGDTYLPEFVTTREVKDEFSAPATQPGMDSSLVAAKQFKDKGGNIYSAERAAELAAQGVEIDGVTVGRGSISDPGLGSQDVSTASSGGVATEKAVEEIKPYSITPLKSTSSGAAPQNSEVVNAESEKLDKASTEAEKWTQDYFDLRLKKSQLVDAKVQLALEEQVGKIGGSNAAKAKVGINAVRYHVPAPDVDQSGFVPPSEEANKPKEEFKPVIYAGETVRAVLKNEINTDNGNEVIAVLQQGPLKGSMIIGTANIQKGNIQFTFNRLLRKNRTEININAIGRQIGSNSSGMADDIQKHYFKRYTALAVSQALKGVGEAYQQTAGSNASMSNGVVVSQSSEPSAERIRGNIAGEIGNELSSEVKQLQNTPTTYITHSGKVFNVFFNRSVQDITSTNNKN